MRFVWVVPSLTLLMALNALSQTGVPSAVKGLHGEAVGISGELGTYGEYYTISGRESRRPTSTARLYFRPTIAIYDAATVSVNILLSTEGSSRSARHQLNQINQLGLQPRWKWGYINAGDFTESYTPLTFNGLLIRGGGFSINPGNLRLAVTGGVTRRIGAGSNEGEFDRKVYSGKLGVGRESGSYFDVLFVSVRDIPSKFKPVEPDSIIQPDSTQIGTQVQYTETPQENLVMGVAGKLKLFHDAFTVRSEASGCAYTRDMNSPELDNGEVPSFIRNLFTPRLSSSADFAYTTNLHVRIKRVNLKAGYRYIGPGYVSLGVASLCSDLRELSWGADVRHARWSTSAAVTRQNDNLIGSKLYTTVRYTYTGNFTASLTRLWHLSLMGNLLTLRNHASSDSALVSYSVISLGANQQMLFDQNRLLKAMSLNYLFSRAIDDNPFRPGNGLQSHTVGANVNMALSGSLSLVPMINVVRSRQGSGAWQSIETYSITPQWRALKNRLFVSSGIGLSRSPSSTLLQTDITARYRLSAKASLRALARRIGFSGPDAQSPNYGEYLVSIRLTQQL